MDTKINPQQLALDLLKRSTCRVQVAAVVSDKHGIFSWGWNHRAADGSGVHAERHAILRANKARLYGARLTIAGKRKKSGGAVCARPCEQIRPETRAFGKSCCMELARKHGIETIEYFTKSGWEVLKLSYVRVSG